MGKKTYLGDGLFASDDGMQITLSAQRDNGVHFVCLESSTLDEFFKFVERVRGVKINVARESTAAASVG